MSLLYTELYRNLINAICDSVLISVHGNKISSIQKMIKTDRIMSGHYDNRRIMSNGDLK